jgi:hypothetical protein
MSRNRDYAVARVHDDSYRLDRITEPVPGPVAFVKRFRDRRGVPLGWRLRPVVVVQGSRSRLWESAAEALASTKLLTLAEARTLTGETSAAVTPRRRTAP